MQRNERRKGHWQVCTNKRSNDLVINMHELRNSIRLEMIAMICRSCCRRRKPFENISGIFSDANRSGSDQFVTRHNELIDRCVDEMMKAYNDEDELINRALSENSWKLFMMRWSNKANDRF